MHTAEDHRGADDCRSRREGRGRRVSAMLVAGRGPAPQPREAHARTLNQRHAVQAVRDRRRSCSSARRGCAAPGTHCPASACARCVPCVHRMRTVAGASAPPSPRAPLLQCTLAAAARLLRRAHGRRSGSRQRALRGCPLLAFVVDLVVLVKVVVGPHERPDVPDTVDPSCARPPDVIGVGEVALHVDAALVLHGVGRRGRDVKAHHAPRAALQQHLHQAAAHQAAAASHHAVEALDPHGTSERGCE